MSEGQKTLSGRGYPCVKALCLDEIAPHKRQGRYYPVISAPELGLVLDVLKDRKKASLEAWFDERGLEWCAAVEVCCADMWDAYHKAAQAKLPHARQTVDRFIVAPNFWAGHRNAIQARWAVSRPEVLLHNSPKTETHPVNSGD